MNINERHLLLKRLTKQQYLCLEDRFTHTISKAMLLIFSVNQNFMVGTRDMARICHELSDELNAEV